MYTPDGTFAADIDKVMLLAIWVEEVQKQLPHDQVVHFAAMGKPTFPIHPTVANALTRYWAEVQGKAFEARHWLSSSPKKHTLQERRDKIAKTKAAAPYGNPQGVYEYRAKMANTLNKWYEIDAVVKPEHILFNVGGVSALHNIFEYLHDKFPNGRIVTPFPYYSLYAGVNNRNFLHPIDIMKQKGYRLTAEALKESIQDAKEKAKTDGKNISAFLFCDPNNPLGTVVGKDEWIKIAAVLREEKEPLIILDEAYAEMVLSAEKNVSLFQVAPDLRDRIVLMRSATKGLSAAGERMAITITQNPVIMGELLKYNIAIVGHAPKSLQYAYAEALSALDETEHENIIDFYKPQVDACVARLHEMGASMPDPDYKVEGTFYVMVDLSDLLGEHLELSAMKALGKNHSGIIKTDEDIAYHLLFKHQVAIAPASYYGLKSQSGYLRITCSGGDAEIHAICDVLEDALKNARINKCKNNLLDCICWKGKLDLLKNQFSERCDKQAEQIAEQFQQLAVVKLDALTSKELKEQNQSISNLLSEIKSQYFKLLDKDDAAYEKIAALQSLYQATNTSKEVSYQIAESKEEQQEAKAAKETVKRLRSMLDNFESELENPAKRRKVGKVARDLFGLFSENGLEMKLPPASGIVKVCGNATTIYYKTTAI